jgi:hypothetical protein
MTEYAWPAVLRPSRLSFYLQHNTLRFVSPVTRATQVLRREGARWVAEASFEPLDRPTRQESCWQVQIPAWATVALGAIGS